MRGWRILLLPFSILYFIGVIIRNWLFDLGGLEISTVKVPVVSVGNLSAGGTGKTPLVELIATKLRDRGRRAAVISRGYGRKSRGYVVVSNGSQVCAEAADSGDEPALLAERLKGVIVAVDEDRVRGARNVIGDFDVQVIVLDDGFQHRYLDRNLDIVVLSSDELERPTYLLPVGNRREPLRSLSRADLIVISRCSDAGMFERLKAKLERWNKPVIGMAMNIRGVKRALSGEALDRRHRTREGVLAFSGIGSPASFEKTLSSCGMNVKKHLMFRDHHWYSNDDLLTIVEASKQHGASIIATTEKDLARLRGGQHKWFLEQQPVYVVEVEAAIIAGKDILEEKLRGI